MANGSPSRLAVAYSGGRDSTALLHAVCRAARESGLAVHALHVHHGLSPNADAWQQHCETQCRRWARSGYPVHLHVKRVKVAAVGESVEAEARRQRYAALGALAKSLQCEVVLLAHHREDQAETVLLQALRGAGVAGLSAMPRDVVREGVRWVRPWLAQPRSAIEAYVRRHRLTYVDDDSNADPRWDRNRLRLSVWPALVQAFPNAAASLGDVARQAQDARACVDALADIDQQQVADTSGALLVSNMSALAPARRRHLLRHWLQQATGEKPSRALIDRLAIELVTTPHGEWASGDGTLRLYRGRLRWVRNDTLLVAGGPVLALHLDGPGDIPVPAWGGVLRVCMTAEGGMPARRGLVVQLRPRHGGERFQRTRGTPPRSLKKQFQTAAVPAWRRSGPLVYTDAALLYVPGLGIDARRQAAEGTPQWRLEWVPVRAGEEPR